MRSKQGFWMVFLALLALFAFVQPHTAFAQGTVTTTQTNILPPPMCVDGTFNKNVELNRTAALQLTATNIVNVTNKYPIVSASNACIEGIISALQKLPALADPMNLSSMIVTQLVTGIINQACAAGMNIIGDAQNVIKNATTICMPMPNFSLNLNANFSTQACSGGTPLSPITSFTSPTQAAYSVSKILQH